MKSNYFVLLRAFLPRRLLGPGLIFLGVWALLFGVAWLLPRAEYQGREVQFPIPYDIAMQGADAVRAYTDDPVLYFHTARALEPFEEWEAALQLYDAAIFLVEEGTTNASQSTEGLSRTETIFQARRGALRCLLALEWHGDFLERMSGNEHWRTAANHEARALFYLKTGRYAQMIPAFLRSQFADRYAFVPVSAALMTGLCWLIFVVHLGRLRFSAGNLALSAAAVLLGMLSVAGTLVVLFVSEEWIGFEKLPPTIIGNMLHMVLGVALREELLKLLFFLPLVPLLLRQDDLSVLVLAALVGLGFAVEENVGYFTAGGGFTVIARFLTANFFHMTLTGFAGLYLVRAVRTLPAALRGRSRAMAAEAWGEFGAQFGLVILLHGAYNFLLTDHNIGDPMIAMIVHAWLAYRFLGLAKELGAGGRRRIPLLNVFFGVCALSSGTAYLMLVPLLGPVQALLSVFEGMLGLAFVAIVFVVQTQE